MDKTEKRKRPTKKELLIEKASKYADYDAKLHGTIARLEAFLADKSKEEITTEKKEDKDLTKLSLQELRKLAKTYGWNKRTGTKVALIEFIQTKMAQSEKEDKRLEAVEKEVVVAHVDEDLEEWPISPEVLAKHSNTVDNLKKLLNAKGIAVGLPRTKKEILDLFKKSRCSFKKFTCSEDEFCDLRNNLCRELNILRNKDKEIKKLAKGLVYIDEEKGRFYGTPDAIAKVRQALVHPLVVAEVEAEKKEAEPVMEKTAILVPEQQVVKETVTEEVVPAAPAHKEEEGISPININRLLDKPSENEIRRAILHCLGLYHDIDPNDEIIISS